MRLTLALAVGTALALGTSSSAEAGAGAGRPPVALAVSPARVALVAPASRTIGVRNVGAERVVVDVARKSADRRRAAEKWLSIHPARLLLRAGSRALLTLRVRAHRQARPGDHQVLVLLIARPLDRTQVAVRMRLGVGVRVRIPGRIFRHLELRGLRVRLHRGALVLLVSVANRGNVTEQLRGRMTVTLLRSGRVVSRLRPRGPRVLFPGAHAVLAMRYAGRVRGLVTAVVKVRFDGRLRPLERRYRIRL